LSRSGNVKTLEGKPLDTTFIALLEFPSAEAVNAFATDAKYAPYAAARQAASEIPFQLIVDTPVAGGASPPSKGIFSITEPHKHAGMRHMVESSYRMSRTIAEQQKFQRLAENGPRWPDVNT